MSIAQIHNSSSQRQYQDFLELSPRQELDLQNVDQDRTECNNTLKTRQPIAVHFSGGIQRRYIRQSSLKNNNIYQSLTAAVEASVPLGLFSKCSHVVS